MKTPAGRLVGIDLARGLALLGMMLAHLGPPWSGYDAPPASVLVAEGRAAVLFAVLAGLSVGLMERLDATGVGSRAAVLRRAGALFVIGLALASLPHLTVLVILPCYAVLVAATVVVRGLSTRVLLGLAAAWCVVSPFVLFGLRQVIDEPMKTHIQPSFAGDLVRLPLDVAVWGGYPAVVWFGYVLLGVALSRLDLADRAVAVRLLQIGAAAVIVSAWIAATAMFLGALRGQWGEPHVWSLWWPPSTLDPRDPTTLLAAGLHTSTPLNVVGAAGSAVLVIGASLLVMRSRPVIRVLAPLRAAGTMTLTLYCLHVALVWAIREYDASFTGGYYTEWWVQVVVLVALAWLWRSIVPRGPLEELVRRISLWRLVGGRLSSGS